jgi:endoglucanase
MSRLPCCTWIFFLLAAAAVPPCAPTKPRRGDLNDVDDASVAAESAKYAEALGLSWLFYEAQQSGNLTASNRAKWRKSAHTSDPIPGGFYDAGDHLKLNFPLASSATLLAWSLLEFPCAYNTTRQGLYARATLKRISDYLVNCHVAPDKYVAQIGSPGVDHSYWGRPEGQTGPRPAYIYDSSKPASDALGAAAAALASASLALRLATPARQTRSYLARARQLFDMAAAREGKYSDSYSDATYVYQSYSYLDDLAFAAAWLYRASGEIKYLDKAKAYVSRIGYSKSPYVSWDSVFFPTDVLLKSMGVRSVGGIDLAAEVQKFAVGWRRGDFGVRYSPKGLAVAPLGGWGTLRYAANAAFVQLLIAKYADSAAEAQAAALWAKGQVDYILGAG